MGFSTLNVTCCSLHRDMIGWNKAIQRQMHEGNVNLAFSVFIRMRESGFHPDNFTFPLILKAAGRSSLFYLGCALHGQAIKSGYYNHLFVRTALLNMYSTFKDIQHAYKVFEKIPVKDIIAWNSMLDSYASNGKMEEASNLFESIPEKDLTSFNIMISGYAKAGELELARSIFNAVPERDVASWNSMILACKLAGCMEEARRLFEEAPSKNIVTWNTMLSGYIQNELHTDAIRLFDEMKAQNLKPDQLTVAGVLAACAHLSSLEAGITIHIYALENHLMCSEVTTSLIDMYAKCGTINRALEVFCKSWVKDIFCWNAIISGLAINGHGLEALKLFNAVKYDKFLKPDDITLIAILSACSHSGLVQEGCSIFASMNKDFGISPKLEHYGCMVDLLGRANFLNQALELVESMPFEPGERILGALLSACVIHQDMEVGKKVATLIIERDGGLSDGEIMMMSNLYASFGEWEEAAIWREKMEEEGIVKTAGCSVIQLNGKTHRFLAGDST
ncbi:hypothetical protein SOVF_115540 [Spinacia oleracea]|uniref:Pentatricopeptide repeat-containing protein At3g29230 n=1 Tax=Spinacia oleracea TaxID=3562 RepID=A0A9R0JG11_SPIOL|nr:pentatricopeptide repeat-containing protein At3g29230-like [Spinacia oleracea]XP_056691394.1 pentatricopeptide repeat-containing protein At3g29230-like [Spinacia oleracea]XP_056691397.1 pentatricopeptide repeat-containing protein At3g29230-like [Spinacia oleracea]XP_056691400.1 pentatricopeptide repeat-containing protein At3g29230-like [Spinacia oleracea]KNA13559.1 hypothetical protein SOVF_115540 [Spinacia oleracea]